VFLPLAPTEIRRRGPYQAGVLLRRFDSHGFADRLRIQSVALAVLDESLDA
jgi:hypothetical protein